MPSTLPVPPHFNPDQVGKVWRVPYEQRAAEARSWAEGHAIAPAFQDRRKVALILVDVQNTFCIPEFELFVAGRSGTGAVEDNRRLAEFIYCNLGAITHISATLDTHHAMQIFHAVFLVDEFGNHPAPYTLVSVQDVETGRWRFNPAIAPSLGITPEYGQEHLLHYVRQLQNLGKYELTIWPYHAMQGGIGHALVSSIEEAIFFHTIARNQQSEMVVKGDNTLTESYSAIGPEVVEGPDGRRVGRRQETLIQKVFQYDAVIIAGQAKSHCVAWTVDDLLAEIREKDPALASKIYLLEDCSSPVVVPGADFTDAANAAYDKFASAGMRIVRSTLPLGDWPGFP